MKQKRVTIIIILIGVLICFIPVISDLLSAREHSRAVSAYEEELSKMDDDELEKMKAQARAYNLALAEGEEGGNYIDMLNLGEIIGTLKIPKIKVVLPIYHGTSEDVLQHGVGHWEKSSLPTGGVGNHTVLSGHRGLPRAELFSNLDKMEEGDLFFICVLDDVLAYKVTKIMVVDPKVYEEEALVIDPEKDLATLMTCTPYGVNTHRLLVTGERTMEYDPALLDIEVKEEESDIRNVAHQEESGVQYFAGTPRYGVAFPERKYGGRRLIMVIMLMLLAGSGAVTFGRYKLVKLWKRKKYTKQRKNKGRRG